MLALRKPRDRPRLESRETDPGPERNKSQAEETAGCRLKIETSKEGRVLKQLQLPKENKNVIRTKGERSNHRIDISNTRIML